MKFLKHGELVGQHAFLGASKYHWINYDEDRLDEAYERYLATQLGTELHEFACSCIRLGQRLPKNRRTLNQYVNDAIGYSMTPEQVLFYSRNCFGTADAISFDKNILRIHDLKTGIVPAHMEQLEIYAALFCMEYQYNPKDIQIELRIYQNDEITAAVPEHTDISSIMEKIRQFDKRIEKLRTEE